MTKQSQPNFLPPELDTERKNFFRCLPTWDLICELMSLRHITHIRPVLRERIQACGAEDLMGLVYMEAVYYDTGLPQTVAWDPAIVNAGITLPEQVAEDDADDDGVRPLRLKWIAKTQMWAASTLLVEPEAHMATFGYYATLAEADAAYRALVGLDGDRATKVRVNGEK